MATVDLLSSFVGMVTDSRKLVSFGSRTEMFRRVLCSVLGKMVDNGQMPFKEAGYLAKRVCYDKPFELFSGDVSILDWWRTGALKCVSLYLKEI